MDRRIARVLADVADGEGWDWAVDDGHEPNDRLTVLPYKTGYALVYRGSEPDSADFFVTKAQAQKELRRQRDNILGR